MWLWRLALSPHASSHEHWALSGITNPSGNPSSMVMLDPLRGVPLRVTLTGTVVCARVVQPGPVPSITATATRTSVATRITVGAQPTRSICVSQPRLDGQFIVAGEL